MKRGGKTNRDLLTTQTESIPIYTSVDIFIQNIYIKSDNSVYIYSALKYLCNFKIMFAFYLKTSTEVTL